MSNQAGLNAIYNLMRQIYPDQANPLQVSAYLKYWLNGPDPLDFITMYANSGDTRLGVPPHWHYISCGLSDLYGDGRVHDVASDEGFSGYGFELTMRLIRKPSEDTPPTWPAQLLQSLAKYVFKTDASFCSGDHISWFKSLDFQNPFIEHMLVADDPQLTSLITPFGTLNFVQVVGVCQEELKCSQHWNGHGILNLMKQIPEAGGYFLLTNTERTQSIFSMNSRLIELVETGIREEGSDLSGVGANCWWSECSKETLLGAAQQAANDIHNKSTHKSIQLKRSTPRHQERLSVASNYSSVSGLASSRPIHDAIQLRFNLEAATMLPLAIRGRLAHGRHFTFKSMHADSAITFVTNDITGASVDQNIPHSAIENWLQILIADDFLEILARDLNELKVPDEVRLPRLYVWPERNLMITIVENER